MTFPLDRDPTQLHIAPPELDAIPREAFVPFDHWRLTAGEERLLALLVDRESVSAEEVMVAFGGAASAIRCLQSKVGAYDVAIVTVEDERWALRDRERLRRLAPIRRPGR